MTDGAQPELGSSEGLAGLRERVLDLEETVDQLHHALDSRILVEQATGILAERYDVPVADAFSLLRGSARSAGMNLHLLAAAVVASERRTPDPILARLRASGQLELQPHPPVIGRSSRESGLTQTAGTTGTSTPSGWRLPGREPEPRHRSAGRADLHGCRPVVATRAPNRPRPA